METIKHFVLNEYTNYILLTSNEDLYFSYEEIRKRLKNNENTILVDMFYRNGFSFNRFVELIYSHDGKTFSRIVNPREVSEEIKRNTTSFFKSNVNLLNKSTLTNSIKRFILES